MSVALLLIRDGRDTYHEQCLESACAMLPMELFDQVVTVDDRNHELGFAGAIQRGWDQLETSFVFHLEADFLFHVPVPVQSMLTVLDQFPHLAQLVLKRQPWNESEKLAGGIVEQHPDDYQEREWAGWAWTEHRRFFSTNPSIYSSRIFRMGWPQEPQSEGVFTHKLLKDPHLRFAFWGSKYARPTVQHIGHDRAGVGY